MLTAAEPKAICRDYLLAVADQYRVYCNLAMSTVSNKFYGNARFFDRYRADKCTISMNQYWATIDLFKADWPNGLSFPKFPPIRIAAPKRKRQKSTG